MAMASPPLISTLNFNSTFFRTLISSLSLIILLTMNTSSAVSPIITINSPDGDIVDSVRKETQPALSHPLLKDHKFQEKPINFPNMENYENEVGWQVWHRSEIRCPDGTIPIRRVHESAQSIGGVEATLGHEYVIGFMNHSNQPKIYGTKATMNIWQPEIQRSDEFSFGQIWLVSGSYNTSDLNNIEAG